MGRLSPRTLAGFALLVLIDGVGRLPSAAAGSVTPMPEITPINPAALPHNPAFSQGVSVAGGGRTIYVGGQNGIGADGGVIAGGVGEQTAQALANVEHVINEVGGGLEHVAFWTILIVQGESLEQAFAAFQRAWGRRPNPPAISVAFVSGLANPNFLVEISAVAVVDAG
jgi:enamine deaminase RidA (YjgF/YER057c/UK114 family)